MPAYPDILWGADPALLADQTQKFLTMGALAAKDRADRHQRVAEVIAQQQNAQDQRAMDEMRLMNQDRQFSSQQEGLTADRALREKLGLGQIASAEKIAGMPSRNNWRADELNFADLDRKRSGKIAEMNFNALNNAAYDKYWNQYLQAPTLYKQAMAKTPQEFQSAVRKEYEMTKAGLLEKATPLGIYWDANALDERGRPGRFVFPDSATARPTDVVNPSLDLPPVAGALNAVSPDELDKTWLDNQLVSGQIDEPEYRAQMNRILRGTAAAAVAPSVAAPAAVAPSWWDRIKGSFSTGMP